MAKRFVLKDGRVVDTEKRRPEDGVDKLVADGRRWKRVKAPRVWRPGEGEVLIGTYRGRRPKHGQYGDYEVGVVETAELGVFTVSGAMVMSMLESVAEGAVIRIEYHGLKPGTGERTYKAFEVFEQVGG